MEVQYKCKKIRIRFNSNQEGVPRRTKFHFYTKTSHTIVERKLYNIFSMNDIHVIFFLFLILKEIAHHTQTQDPKNRERASELTQN